LSEPDGQHISGYNPAIGQLLIVEAADILRALGFAASHVVLIGGLVPGLLVPMLDPGIEPHVGTADIDLCLSLALVEGDTETYERMETVIKSLDFEEGDASFRWRRHSGLPLTVEFFCPAGEELAAEREALGLSQTVVAARMHTSQSAVARLESAEIDAKLSTVEHYAAALGKRINWELVDA